MSFVYLVLCCCLKAKSLVGIEPYKRAFDLLNSSSEIKGGPLSGFMKKWSIDWVHEGGPRTRDPYFEWMDEGMNEWMNEWSLSIVDDVRSGCPVSQARDSCIKFSTKHSHLFDFSLRIKNEDTLIPDCAPPIYIHSPFKVFRNWPCIHVHQHLFYALCFWKKLNQVLDYTNVGG